MQLYDYQQTAIQQIETLFLTKRKILLQPKRRISLCVFLSSLYNYFKISKLQGKRRKDDGGRVF